ncbi:hypothetical protein ACFWYW_14645 [Nonomuraea sp. NPDC059023]|uniref:hypothetical protein n=1 Tax=unclassified Nonomuraea TaxID=2593643 RepID=UPI003698882E
MLGPILILLTVVGIVAVGAATLAIVSNMSASPPPREAAAESAQTGSVQQPAQQPSIAEQFVQPQGEPAPSTTENLRPGAEEVKVRLVAQRLFDAYAGADYGGFWDGWSAQGQRLISRADYVRFFQLCPQIAAGVRFTIGGVTVAGQTAKVQVNRLIATLTYDFVLEGGQWRYVPTAEQQREYGSGSVDQIAADKRSRALCGGATPAR